MASVSKDSKGWRIRYYSSEGKQKSIRPGKVNKATAERIGRHVDALAVQIVSRGTLERQTAIWLGEIGDKLHAKLVNAGLTEPRIQVSEEADDAEQQLLLLDFMQDHIDNGRTAKGGKAARSTLNKWRATQTLLNTVFQNKPLNQITPEDAHQFRVWLDNRRIKQKTAGRKGLPMAENAKRTHIATCKTFFDAARRRGLVSSNPFENQVSGTVPNRSRDFYVTPNLTSELLRAAPDKQWKLMIALWRLAGLRKMEIFNLTWGDVQAKKGRLRVRASKTAHLDGCEIRYVPLRDIQAYLDDAITDAFPKASPPARNPVITRYNRANSNLDKPLRDIIEGAGLTPWPKLFQNLRASCETQWLKDGERADLVANWMGHSVKVQRLNYVQETDEDIEAFNARPQFKSGLTSGLADAGTRQNKAEQQGHDEATNQ